jgi:hypothetical protein
VSSEHGAIDERGVEWRSAFALYDYGVMKWLVAGLKK